MIIRETYLNKLIEYKDNGFIKVITGVRRCGKSSLLKMYHSYLLANEPGAELLYLNMELFENISIRNKDSFVDYINSTFGKLDKTRKYYFLFDELQNVEGWEEVVIGLHASGNVDIVLTGSNAYLLSSDLATLLSGRYIRIDMLPLSFVEYLEFNKLNPSEIERRHAEEELRNYLEYGSFPATVLAGTAELKRDYLSSLYDSIIVRDIITRHQVKDVQALHHIISFMFETIGKPFAIKNIVNSIKAAGGKTSHETIVDYINALVEAFVLYPVAAYDTRGKKLFSTKRCYYAADSGLRNAVVSPLARNTGSLLENIVFLELKRRGYKMFTGYAGENEIDFVARRDQDLIYVQVTSSLENENTRAREYRSLNAVKDNYPKYVLTLDNLDWSKNGIKQVNLIDFLLGKPLT